jgi:NAD-dependent DNA ligase
MEHICKNCKEEEYKLICGEVIGRCKECVCYTQNEKDLDYFVAKEPIIKNR